MMTIFNFQFSIFNFGRQRGFTLIELMVVLSVTAVLGTLGVAGFINYNQVQVLQSSANDVATMLNLAKSRSQSQIKPTSLCPTQSLDGYKLIIAADSEGKYRKYTLYIRCSGADIKVSQQDKTLPSDLTFSSYPSFLFPVVKGGVQTADQVVISGYGRSKTIIVNSLGGVNIQ